MSGKTGHEIAPAGAPTHLTVVSSVALPFLSSPVVAELSRHGIAVECWTGMSLARYAKLRSSKLGAPLRRLFDALWILRIGLALALRTQRSNERIVVTSNPPLLPPLVALISRLRRFNFVFLVLDLYPEALVAARRVREGGFLFRALDALAAFSFASASKLVFLGAQIATFASSRYSFDGGTSVLVLGPSEELGPSVDHSSDTLAFIYSGNLGPLHAADTLVAALGVVSKFSTFCGTIELVVRGSEVTSLARLANGAEFIRVHPPLEGAAWRKLMQRCAVSIVTLGVDAQNVSFPSKAWSALAAGHAVLAVCSGQSDLALLVLKHDLGWVIPADDPTALAELMIEIATPGGLRHEELRRKRQNAQSFAERELTPEAIAIGWINAIR